MAEEELEVVLTLQSVPVVVFTTEVQVALPSLVQHGVSV